MKGDLDLEVESIPEVKKTSKYLTFLNLIYLPVYSMSRNNKEVERWQRKEVSRR